ncbi:DNA alkylation repair protein [Vibrio astriarenae]|uniref:DNA alkylation repair protein n=1 Tax=Vibrio astriarenae TaxID=1481923 RepID=UPI0037351DA1
MSTLFKDLYSDDFYQQLVEALTLLTTEFNKQQFLSLIHCSGFAEMEMKQRVSHTTQVLHKCLDCEFERAVPILLNLVEHFESQNVKPDSLQFLFIPEYIERYGQQHFKLSIAAFTRITPFISCEFAVRPFIEQRPQQMFTQMQRWMTHDHRRVRRLASEGFRPRLPWGMALSHLKHDPEPLRPMFELLMRDSCEWVRLSVANNLNDIAKDNPQWVIDFASSHIQHTPEIDKVIKHGCRTLLKQAEPQVMALFGFSSDGLTVANLSMQNDRIQLGGDLEFSFTVVSHLSKSVSVRIEYAIDYQKKNGSLSRKVYKISERPLASNSIHSVERKQHFRPITTRRYHSGLHRLAIIVNGKEMGTLEFHLAL